MKVVIVPRENVLVIIAAKLPDGRVIPSRKIDKNTLELCQLYPWPGDIRELRNIVERSVILTSGDTSWIEKAWLPARSQAGKSCQVLCPTLSTTWREKY
jgi:DNA-binding NtrC family response regulator